MSINSRNLKGIAVTVLAACTTCLIALKAVDPGTSPVTITAPFSPASTKPLKTAATPSPTRVVSPVGKPPAVNSPRPVEPLRIGNAVETTWRVDDHRCYATAIIWGQRTPFWRYRNDPDRRWYCGGYTV